MEDGEMYILVFTDNFQRVMRNLQKKNPTLVQSLVTRFPKLTRNPELGKPLRNSLRNFRRMHVEGSFVLLYEIRMSEVHLMDFDHHDKIYKKYT